MGKIFIGIDLGATNVKIGCFDGEINLIEKTSVPTNHDAGPEAVVEIIGKASEKLLADSLAVEEAGAFALVLEAIPTGLGEEITKKLTIPTIGIGAGIHCDGQVLVSHDLLGLFSGPRPSFVKTYCDLKEIISGAVRKYLEEVRAEEFPDEEHSYH